MEKKLQNPVDVCDCSELQCDYKYDLKIFGRIEEKNRFDSFNKIPYLKKLLY